MSHQNTCTVYTVVAYATKERNPNPNPNHSCTNNSYFNSIIIKKALLAAEQTCRIQNNPSKMPRLSKRTTLI